MDKIEYDPVFYGTEPVESSNLEAALRRLILRYDLFESLDMAFPELIDMAAKDIFSKMLPESPDVKLVRRAYYNLHTFGYYADALVRARLDKGHGTST